MGNGCSIENGVEGLVNSLPVSFYNCLLIKAAGAEVRGESKGRRGREGRRVKERERGGEVEGRVGQENRWRRQSVWETRSLG